MAFEEPVAPRKVDKGIPAELETIVLKAMEKNPADRYATAKDLADDLRRFLDDQPIEARRPSIVQRVRKWGKRHRGLVGTVSASFLLLILLAIAGLAADDARVRHEKSRPTWRRRKPRKTRRSPRTTSGLPRTTSGLPTSRSSSPSNSATRLDAAPTTYPCACRRMPGKRATFPEC